MTHPLRKLDKTIAHKKYISFYKFHYRKLAKEHKKWTPIKISFIIKLLWKRQLKREQDSRMMSKKVTRLSLKTKRITKGKSLFRKVKKSEGMLR